ncbi:DNA repair protein RAD51 [Artemisia annua]|uniref:DNA repair protein RAD51 n=1 Tax=Artemisia annua TaxID=35608 RepID=A0A2U1PR29_ARTAN|nr:DNA repair protein RAD51 [Artemisia annua]
MGAMQVQSWKALVNTTRNTVTCTEGVSACEVGKQPKDFLENIFFFRLCIYTEQIALVDFLEREPLFPFDKQILILNQVTTKYSDGSFHLVPALGNTWSHASTIGSFCIRMEMNAMHTFTSHLLSDQHLHHILRQLKKSGNWLQAPKIKNTFDTSDPAYNSQQPFFCYFVPIHVNILNTGNLCSTPIFVWREPAFLLDLFLDPMILPNPNTTSKNYPPSLLQQFQALLLKVLVK